MKVLIADKFQQWGVDALEQAGCGITYEPALEGESLREAVASMHCAVLVVRSTKVTAAILAASDELALVVRAGAGYNTIDLAAASGRGILVANCPGKNAVAVAELTFALILALDRRIVENVNDLRQGIWNKKEYSQAKGLKGRTLGLLGFGQIGQAVAKRARAFSMPVAAWSRSLTDGRAASHDVTRCASPAEVASRADILSVHLASTAETRGIVNAELLERLARGSFLINTSRADLVDYEALSRAVARRSLRVGIDVYPNEPASGQASFDDAIVRADGLVCGTHHIGASTEQAQHAIAEEAVRIVRAYQQSGQVLNCVNVRRRPHAPCTLAVRHLNRPGVLAFVLNRVSMAGINVEEMENVICDGDDSACAQIKLERPLDEAVLASMRADNEHIINVSQSHVSV